MNKEEFIKYIANLNIENTNLKKLDIYYNFMKEYNQHTNLTAIIKEEDVYLKHFYDSLTITKAIDLSKVSSLIDIGTGAGFPGMILKIFFPHLNVTLLDSNGKKTKFLEELAQKLNITENITIVKARSEDYIKENREKFDVITSRGVVDLKILTELSMPFIKEGGYFIPLKGKVEEELKNAHAAITILGGTLEKKIEFKLPIENSIRTIPIIKKVNKTPLKYPRNYSSIIKKPLK